MKSFKDKKVQLRLLENSGTFPLEKEVFTPFLGFFRNLMLLHTTIAYMPFELSAPNNYHFDLSSIINSYNCPLISSQKTINSKKCCL